MSAPFCSFTKGREKEYNLNNRHRKYTVRQDRNAQYQLMQGDCHIWRVSCIGSRNGDEFYRDLNSVGTVTAMRNAAHGTLYALANSFAVTRAVAVPKWVKTTYAVDAVVAIILVAWEICAICKYRKAKKEDEGTEQ